MDWFLYDNDLRHERVKPVNAYHVAQFQIRKKVWKFKTFNFTQFLVSVITYKFKKILISKMFKRVAFEPKNWHLPHFGKNKNFSQKSGFVTF